MVPGTSASDARPPLPPTERHVPLQTPVEPKAFLPHDTAPGQVPRRIEVERKKREYSAVNLRTSLQQMGVLEKLLDMELRAFLGDKLTTPVDDIPLPCFDDTEFDSRPEHVWAALVNEMLGSGLPARAKDVQIVEESRSASFDYKACRVVDYDGDTRLFSVVFPSRDPVRLDRVYICFDAEDPVVYCQVHTRATSARPPTPYPCPQSYANPPQTNTHTYTISCMHT